MGQYDPPSQETEYAGKGDPISENFPEDFHFDLLNCR
jgi:hypothetical protein